MIFIPGSMFRARAPGWIYDLSGPNEPAARSPVPAELSYAPNFIDEHYMELPRSDFKARGVAAWASLTLVPLVLYLCYFSWIGPDAVVLKYASLVKLGIVILISWIGLYFWRLDTETPLDEPIRFNRARRKIYVYRFRHSALRLFSRVAWGVYPQVYNWDDLRAEFCSLRAVGVRGLVEFLAIAVVEPASGKVVDRFILAHGRQESEMYWAMAQLYMQKGPGAVPKFEASPRDWNNEIHFENIARRLAPKVKWPAVMDIESRTGL